MLTTESVLSASEGTILLNILKFPFLSQDDCKSIDSLIERNQTSHAGSMQKYTIDVLTSLNNFLQNICLKELIPIINELFYFGKSNEYEIYTAHLILYKFNGEGEKSLKLHTDDSDITVTITLETDELEGSELEFMGTSEYGNAKLVKNFDRIRKSIQSSLESHKISLKSGDCLIHRGNHPHQTTVIKHGSRKTLVIWLKKKL